MPLPAWFQDTFRVAKPVIAMAHLPALPGTPRYDAAGGVSALVDRVAADCEHLIAGGVDAVMFCNEDDRPYVFTAGLEQIAAMTRVVTELRPSGRPFGVDFLWDPLAAMAVAHATGASFVREVLTGVYESDMGLWSPDAGKVARFRRTIGADGVRMFYNVVPEFASPLGTRTVGQRARNALVACLADAILVSGAMAGEEPDVSAVRAAKEAVGDEAPVLLNTGAKPDNVEAFLRIADGVIVGSSLKVDGRTWNPVDPVRVGQFMERVAAARAAS
jgi:membrane complex biogenesis BtpA family protein